MKINFQIFRLKTNHYFVKNKKKIKEIVYHNMNWQHLFSNNIKWLAFFFALLKSSSYFLPSLTYLSNIIESCAILVLQVLASRREKCQRVIARMCWLVPAGNQFTVIEEVRGEVNDGLMGAVVLTEHDLTWTVVWVQLIQSVQQRLLEALLLGKV